MPIDIQSRDDFNRIYVKKKKRRGLTSIENFVDASIQELGKYI